MRDYTIFWTADVEGSTGADSDATYDGAGGAEEFFADFFSHYLTYVQPKTNWTLDDKINAEDFNAIESNTETIAAYLKSIQYSMPDMTIVTDRDQTYIDYLSSINRIEQNIEAIRTNFVTPPGYGGSKTWGRGLGFNNTDANRLERNLQQLMEYGLLVFESFRYCGTFYSGEEFLP